ncbi:unnamed protein product [Brassica napus]|uniref:(rape) hypothetical protein n=1 Tax=Brassica napus TaxID=3708 RepID=A0A817B651_BRANA|nr:unnamed protein product [Brassica napus]
MTLLLGGVAYKESSCRNMIWGCLLSTIAMVWWCSFLCLLGVGLWRVAIFGGFHFFPNKCAALSTGLALCVAVWPCWFLFWRSTASCSRLNQILKSSSSGTPISTGLCLSQLLWFLLLWQAVSANGVVPSGK